jgi:hypothetical protein
MPALKFMQNRIKQKLINFCKEQDKTLTKLLPCRKGKGKAREHPE